MIKFFRHIRLRLITQASSDKVRKRMLTENPSYAKASAGKRVSKYMLYAFGEIILVMIGILLALQVNDWNEKRKQLRQEVQLYMNLQESLTADSADVERIRGLLEDGMRAQRYLISKSYQELVEENSLQGLRDSIEQTTWVATSFFPRYSAYNQITNNGYTALLHSEEIKSKLIELYDRRYKRYLHIDASVDEKSEFHYEPVVAADLLILHPFYEIQSSDQFDLARFETHYPELKRECISILITASYADNALKNSQETIYELLALIRTELVHSKQ